MLRSENVAVRARGNYRRAIKVSSTVPSINLDEQPKLGLIHSFKEYLRKWHDETDTLSDIDAIVENDNFKMIAGFGSKVLPFLFKDLEERPSFLFLAASDITGANPVSADSVGHVDLMSADWLRWAAREGIYDTRNG